MDKWNKEKLDKMTKMDSEFTRYNLNFNFIAENFEEMVIKTYLNGDLIPLEFEDVKTAYDGDPIKEIELPEISDDLQSKIDEINEKRNIMHIKHFSRSISHEAWFNFLDEEVDVFIEKYPEFKESIIL
ncbi:MAG: hypothetical protein IJJ47_06930 [Methanosphaera sp.]|nr:hypothetical protein [Methanosphaera sp.]